MLRNLFFIAFHFETHHHDTGYMFVPFCLLEREFQMQDVINVSWNSLSCINMCMYGLLYHWQSCSSVHC